MTHSCMWRDSPTCVPWLTHMCLLMSRQVHEEMDKRYQNFDFSARTIAVENDGAEGGRGGGGGGGWGGGGLVEVLLGIRGKHDWNSKVSWLRKRGSRFSACWYVFHDSFIRVSWLIHMCDMTHSYVCRDSFICVTWLFRTCVVTHSCVWHDSFVRVSWLIHMCDMTHSRVLRCIRVCDTTCLYVWHDASICVPWLMVVMCV